MGLPSPWPVRCVNGIDRLDLPQLQSIKLGRDAFINTRSFEMFNLPSLQVIDFGQGAFRNAVEFSLSGICKVNDIQNRPSSTSHA